APSRHARDAGADLGGDQASSRIRQLHELELTLRAKFTARERKRWRISHCEKPTGPREARPDDRLRDEAIHPSVAPPWIASRSLSSGAHSRDPLARNAKGHHFWPNKTFPCRRAMQQSACLRRPN